MSTDLQLKSRAGEPTWEIAKLFPLQGEWSVEDYLRLETKRLIEFDDGILEVLPMPTELHQLIVFYLCSQLSHSSATQGVALLAPFRVRLPSGKFREPDVMFMLRENSQRRKERYWEGADLVMEVVSDDDPNRDLHIKRYEYAQARIREYWIIDPRDRTVRVLVLENAATEYREAGCYGDGQVACSVLLDSLQASVSSVFNQPAGN